MDTRARAVTIIEAVTQTQQTLNQVLDRELADCQQALDQAFIRDLCFGVFRWYSLLDTWTNALLDKPLKAKDSDIRHLVMLGLYQIAFQRTPDHAAVSATVNSTRSLKKNWAKNLVNALLRRFLRERADHMNIGLDEMCGAHPAWILDELQLDWPLDWQQIIIANQARAPLTIRVNRRRCTREQLQARWQDAGIATRIAIHSTDGLSLLAPTDILALPGYESGDFSVQDEAAQLAAGLLQLEPGYRVLDACAAPGGKSSHCLELCPELETLVAVDNDAVRLERLKTNLKRLKLQATVLQADVSDSPDWSDQQAFDRILLDVPCTASGVIRRHPDIKYHRHRSDLEQITQTQMKILENIWPLLRTGGKLVYSTCSVFKQENDAQMAAFTARHPDAVTDLISADWGRETALGRQILPGQDDMDGFYYCRLIKQ